MCYLTVAHIFLSHPWHSHAAEQHSRDEEEKQSLKTTNKELAEKLNVISKQIEELQRVSQQEKERNQKLLEDNQRLKLDKWKQPRYIIVLMILIFCVVLFVFYFVLQDWPYNYAAKLLSNIDSFEGIKHDIAKGVLFTIHGGIFLLSVNALINLIMIDNKINSKYWFLKILKSQVNK